MNDVQKIPIKTVCGTFVLEMTEKGLYAVRFPRGTGSFSEKRDRHLFLKKRSQSLQKKCLSTFIEKLRNRTLDLAGYSPFQKVVYAALMKVPAGKVITYGELAKRAGYPGAARAVGTAMKTNRLPIAVPCHRVIKADGSLGQYSQGVLWKKELLAHEKYFSITPRPPKVPINK